MFSLFCVEAFILIVGQCAEPLLSFLCSGRHLRRFPRTDARLLLPELLEIICNRCAGRDGAAATKALCPAIV